MLPTKSLAASTVAVAAAVFLSASSIVSASPTKGDLALSTRQQSEDSPLLVDYPACDYYRCIVTWSHGQSTYINWINAPYGTVQLSLMINNNTDVGYEIANVTSPSQPGYCDDGSGVGTVDEGQLCGQFAFIVPSEWTTGRNYSVRAQLVSDTSVVSYTDVVQIQDANGTSSTVDYAFSTVSISGAPSTTVDDGTSTASFTGSYTAARSPGAVVSSSSSSASSSVSSAASSAAKTGSSSAASAATSASSSASHSGAQRLAFYNFHLGSASLALGALGVAAFVGAAML